MRGVLVLLLGILFTSATGGATAEATKVARSSHRKLLQAAQAPDPFILSPLVPINWFIFRDAPLYVVSATSFEGPSLFCARTETFFLSLPAPSLPFQFNLNDPVISYW